MILLLNPIISSSSVARRILSPAFLEISRSLRDSQKQDDVADIPDYFIATLILAFLPEVITFFPWKRFAGTIGTWITPLAMAVVLRKEADAFAKSHKLKRSQMFADGLRLVLERAKAD